MALALSLAPRIEEAADLVTVALDELLPRAEGPEARLTEAMRYAALGPGKRLRPFFAFETARMFDLPERPVLRTACALECIHAYSLIHDDLPCMDDDDLRRGRPTVHKAYDEATAVLAGDALQSAAFEIMAHPDTHEDGAVRAELVRLLAVASGARGMDDRSSWRPQRPGRRRQDAADEDRGPDRLRLRTAARHGPRSQRRAGGPDGLRP